tara:strand:+ start:33 stop:203 length:171 start_codon:yes stop_codon:yes gene_type:complete
MLKIISIGLILFGLLLYGVSYLFEVFNWPDLFQGIITGVIISGIGILGIIINTIKK